MEYAIIVAGGSGSRMKSDIPKQFIEINGLPILMRTINAFHRYSEALKIILVIPEDQFSIWHDLVKRYHFSISCQLVNGGKTRFNSVENGLATIEGDGLVAIHDGVRPFVSSQIISRSYESAKEFGSGIATVPPKDSIRLVSESGNRNVNRDDYRLVQTPQTFNVDKIKQAYREATNNNFTDDASVFESSGQQICLVAGDYKNIKITTPEDIEIAQALLELDKD